MKKYTSASRFESDEPMALHFRLENARLDFHRFRRTNCFEGKSKIRRMEADEPKRRISRWRCRKWNDASNLALGDLRGAPNTTGATPGAGKVGYRPGPPHFHSCNRVWEGEEGDS